MRALFLWSLRLIASSAALQLRGPAAQVRLRSGDWSLRLIASSAALQLRGPAAQVRLRSGFLAVMLLSACANDLRTDFPFDGETTTGPLVVATPLDTGGTRLQIDATNKMSQVYVDLDEGREMKPDEAFSTNGWDLSLKRFDIFVNSGASGTGTVEIAVLKDVDYDSLTQAPAEGFTADTGDRVFNTTNEGWYFYDLGVHKLVTRTELVYVIHTSAGTYMKLRMLSYYDQAGTPASISLEYAPIAAP